MTLKGHGTPGAIFRELPWLKYNEEQDRALTTIGEELDRGARANQPDAGVERAEQKAALAKLAESVKAGKVDLVAVTARERELAEVEEQRRKRENDALNRVQRVLDSSQRSAVATALRAEAKKPRAGDAGARRGDVSWARKRLDRYVTGIGLDAEREKKVEAILDAEPLPGTDAREAELERRAKLLDAFEHDGFDAFHFPSDPDPDAQAHFVRLARFLAKVVPLLTPEQNAKLAAKVSAPEPALGRPGRPGKPAEDGE